MSTPFAIKYGPAEPNAGFPPPRFITDADRSGLSPVTNPVALVGVDGTQQEIQDLLLYQRSKLASFDTYELTRIQALAYPGARPNAKSSTLTGNFHPLVHKSRWGTRHNYTFQNNISGYAGYWLTADEKVWNILEPILRLVSKYLDNVHTFPWFDALVFSDPVLIPANEVLDGQSAEENYTFNLRPPQEANASKNALKQFLVDMAKDTTFYIGSATVAEVPLGSPKSSQMGWTESYSDPAQGKYVMHSIYIAWELLDPLARHQLSVEERLCHEFHVAVTILHEITHAMFVHTTKGYKAVEHFFDTEELCELGWSFEKAVFSDLVAVLNGNEDGVPRPSLGGFTHTFVGFHFYDRTYPESQKIRHRRTNRFGVGATVDYWPIPLEFFEWLQQDMYWLVTPRCGPTAMYPTRIVGHRFTKKDDLGIDFRACELIVGPGYDRWKQKSGLGFKAIDDAMQVTADLTQEARAQSVQDALRRNAVSSRRRSASPARSPSGRTRRRSASPARSPSGTSR